MDKVAKKIVKMRKACLSHRVFGFIYKPETLLEVTDWQEVPKIDAHIGTLQLSKHNMDDYLDTYGLNIGDWMYIGALNSEDRVIMDKKGAVYMHDPYKNDITKLADSFYEFMDQIVLGNRYLELTGGFEDYWYKELETLGYS